MAAHHNYRTMQKSSTLGLTYIALATLTALGSCEKAGASLDEASAKEMNSSQDSIENAVPSQIEQHRLTRGYLYPYGSRLGYDVYYNGYPINFASECCEGEWHMPAVHTLEMACSGTPTSRLLEIGTRVENPKENDINSYFSQQKQIVLSIDEDAITHYEAISVVGPDANDTETREFRLEELWSSLHSVDLMAYRCNEHTVNLLVEVTTLLIERLDQPVAVDFDAVFHLHYDLNRDALTVVELPTLRLDSQVNKTRMQLSADADNKLNIDCELNIWPCDREVRESRIYYQMREAFGRDGEAVFPSLPETRN